MPHIAKDTPSLVPPNPVLKWIRAKFIERTLKRLPKTSDVLDLCCGYGFYFMINPNACGVDGDPACVEFLSKQGRNVKLFDVTKRLPLGDATFGYVMAHDALEHFVYEDLEKLLAEVHRILKPGGKFVVFVPNRKGYDWGVKVGAGHRLFVTAAEIKKLSEGKFKIEQNYPEPLPRKIGQLFTHNKEVFILAKIG